MNFIDLWRRHDFGGVARRIRPRARRTCAGRSGVPAVPWTWRTSRRSCRPRPRPSSRRWRRRRTGAPSSASAARCACSPRSTCPTRAPTSARTAASAPTTGSAGRCSTDAEILEEARVLRAHGFDSVLLVTGETGAGRPRIPGERPAAPAAAFLGALDRGPAASRGGLRRRSRGDGLSTVLVYQETYDAAAYARHHLSGPKADIEWRLGTPDRLGRAGMKKIGLGALFGLSDWRADAWFTGLHLRHVETVHWRTRTAVSFPAAAPARGRRHRRDPLRRARPGAGGVRVPAP